MKKLILFGILVFLLSISIASAGCCLENDGTCTSKGSSVTCQGSFYEGDCYGDGYSTSIDECSFVSCVFRSGECAYMQTSRCQDFFKEKGGTIRTDLDYDACQNYRGTVDAADCNANKRLDCDKNKVVEVDACNKIIRTVKTCDVYSACKDKEGVIDCYETSCIEGKKTKIRVIDPDYNFPYFQEVEITAKMLGYPQKINQQRKPYRESGESWCVIYGTKDGKNWGLFSKTEVTEVIGEDYKEFKKYSAGSRHSVYTCGNGEIVVEQGDMFRREVCFQNDEYRFFLAASENRFGAGTEKWATCRNDDKFDKVRDDIDEFLNGSGFTPRGARSGTYDFLAEARDLDKRKFSVARLETNYDQFGNCKAEYPIGSYFFTNIVVNLGAPANECNKCGDGWKNICDKDECYRKGDCSFKKAGFSWGGCASGAIAAESILLGYGAIARSAEAVIATPVLV